MKKPNQRVVITGMGVLAPNGNSLDHFWRNTLDGLSGIAPITRFDTTDYLVKIAGEIKEFDIHRYIPAELNIKPKRLGMHTQYGIAATHMAVRHAGLSLASLQKLEPIPFLMGVSTSAIDMIEQGKELLMKNGPSRVSPYTVSASQPHGAVSYIANSLGVNTRQSTFSSACPAGLQAIATAMDEIQSGKSSIAICGGIDSPITPLTLASFSKSGMIKQGEFPPQQSSRPFDAKRKGGIMAEGACVFMLESLENALNRGAKPLCELLGYGSSSDEIDSLPASGLATSMQIALENASKLSSDISFINAHGSSDELLDKIETLAIKQVFGNLAYNIPVTSIKGVTGNPLAAAGPMQLASSVMSMQDNLIPPTANYTYPDPDCDLSYVKNGPLSYISDTVMINLHGLGGGNSSLVIGRYP